MRKQLCILMLLWLCCLGGCRGEEAPLEEISACYSGMEAVTAEASVTANSGVRVVYDIRFSRTAEGDAVEILSPESLAGIKANILPDKAEIAYDGMVAETLLPGVRGYVPADVLTGALDDLAAGVPENYAYDGNAVILTYCADIEGMTARKMLWVDREDYRLLRGEFYLEEQMIMELAVKSFGT